MHNFFKVIVTALKQGTDPAVYLPAVTKFTTYETSLKHWFLIPQESGILCCHLSYTAFYVLLCIDFIMVVSKVLVQTLVFP